MPHWSQARREGFQSWLAQYLKSSWADFYNPSMYRDAGLAEAYAAHPERFVRRPPEPLALPTAAWINLQLASFNALQTRDKIAAAGSRRLNR